MFKTKVVFIFALGILVFACKAQKGAEKRQGITEYDAELDLIMTTGYSGFEQPLQAVVDNPKALEGLFAKINRTRKMGLPLPQVDFQKERIFVYAPGLTTYTDRGLQVSSVTADSILLTPRPLSEKDRANTAESTPVFLYSFPLDTKQIHIK